MDMRGKLGALIAVLVVGGVLVHFLRPVAPAETGVPAAVHRFADGVNAGRLSEALNVISRRFQANGLRRGDIGRGLFQARRDWQSLHIHVSGVTV